jgi:glycosyltransferase involved in cell wall biosynthesis
MTAPLVSIVIPCFENALYLVESIESARSQTYKSIEVVLVDDGTETPEQRDLIDKAAHLVDRFIRLPKNRGLPGARNAGITSSKAEFILPLDSDDLIDPTYVEKAVKAFENAPSNLGIVYCKAKLFGTREGSWELPAFELDRFLFANCIFCTALFRKSLWEEAGGYDETMNSTSEDWELWVKFIERGYVPLRLDETLFFYRQHADTLTTRAAKVKKDGRKMIFDRHPQIYYESYLRNTAIAFDESYRNLSGRDAFNLILKKITKRIRGA